MATDAMTTSTRTYTSGFMNVVLGREKPLNMSTEATICVHTSTLPFATIMDVNEYRKKHDTSAKCMRHSSHGRCAHCMVNHAQDIPRSGEYVRANCPCHSRNEREPTYCCYLSTLDAVELDLGSGKPGGFQPNEDGDFSDFQCLNHGEWFVCPDHENILSSSYGTEGRAITGLAGWSQVFSSTEAYKVLNSTYWFRIGYNRNEWKDLLIRAFNHYGAGRAKQLLAHSLHCVKL